MMIFSWPPEAVDRLQEYWRRGLSASQCARAINEEFRIHLSRNAVIGKAHRLGLAKRGRNDTPQRAEETHQVKKQVRAKARQIAKTRIKQPAVVKAVALESEPPANAVALIELMPHHCRWPLGDPRLPGFRFCGERRAEPLPYCAAHARVAYQTASMRECAA